MLAKFTDQRLLAYRDALLKVEDSAIASAYTASEVTKMDPSLIHFKGDARWQPLYQAVIAALTTRAHIPRR